MKWLNNVSNEQELKTRFRALARRFHPDLGGRAEHFIKLQEEYAALSRKFELIEKGISAVKEGDTVWVNGTECLVTFVGTDIFAVRAKGRRRTGVFRLRDGVGKYEPQFRASVINNFKKTSHA